MYTYGSESLLITLTFILLINKNNFYVTSIWETFHLEESIFLSY